MTHPDSNENLSDPSLKTLVQPVGGPQFGPELDKVYDMLYKSLIKSSGERVYLSTRHQQ